MAQRRLAQRRFRNQIERDLIKSEVATSIERLGLPDDISALRDLTAVMDQFVASENGHHFAGFIEIPELGTGRTIEYSLPGRRFQKQFVRLVTREEPGKAVGPPENDSNPK